MTDNVLPQRSESGKLWQENILKSLTKALDNHRLVVVVGAGVTLNATATEDGQILEQLSWKGLIKDGLRYLVEEGFTDNTNLRIRKAYQLLEGEDNESLLDAADKLKRSLEQYQQFPTWLFSVFGHLKDRISHPAVLYALKGLHNRGATLVTTNYDDLLEVTCGLSRISRSSKEDLLKFNSGDLDGVFHIHGSYDDPPNVVLNSIDYYVVQNDDDARETMKSFFMHKTILFVGCGSGLEDPNFETLLNWAQERYKHIANRHVLLLRDQDRPSEKLNFLLRARCGGPEWDGLTPFLNELLQSSQASQNSGQGGERAPTNSAAVLELLRNSTIKENVRVWLKAPNTFEQHYDACEKRHKDTGNWFIHGEKFQHWLKRKGSFLWLNGFAGSGKSILASTVIQETLARVETSQSTGLAYFYFSYADSSKQSCRSLLSSLILQLSCQSSSEILNELYAEYFAGGPPQYALEKAFKLLVAKFEVTYIVIDALDESPVGLLRDSVCKLVCQLRELSSLHLFVTSRSEPDIRAALKVPAENDVSIQNEEALDDIRRYIGEQLQNDSFSKWENYHREIEDALSRGSHGMFRWVDCQFHTIRSCLTVKMLRTALQSLPQSLDETYDRMLSAIKPEYQDFAQRTLTLLCFSARPIQVCELIEALAVKVGTDSGHYDPEEKLSTAHDLLSICPGMLNVKGPAEDKYDVPWSKIGHRGFSRNDLSRRILHTDPRIVGLAHFSVREYLVSDRVLNSFPKYRLHPDVSHGWIARLCLIYLIYLGLDYSLLPKTSPFFRYWYCGTFDFFDYALSQWSTHARKNGNQSSLFSLVKAIGASHSAALALFSITDNFSASNTLYSRFPLRPQESQIIIVKWLSYHGMADLLDMVLAAAQELLSPQKSTFGLRSTDDEYVTLDGSLLGSSRGKAASSSRTLQELDRNYDLCKEASVNLAILQSHWDVVHRLLSKGFRAATKHNLLVLDPLQIAARDGQHEAVSLMLKRRKDFDVYYTREASDLKHPMLLAAANGHSTTVATLLRAGIGAKGLKGPHDVTPLILASRRGHVEVVKVLLKQELDHQNDYGMTALMSAAQWGHLDVVKILVKNGARWRDLADVDGNNALGYAVKNNNQHIVDFLSTQGVPRKHRSQSRSNMNPTESCGKYETSRAAINLPWKSRIIETDHMSAAFAGTPSVYEPEDVWRRRKPDSDDSDSDDAAVLVVKVDHGEPIAAMSGAVDVMDLDIDDADVRIAKFDDAVR